MLLVVLIILFLVVVFVMWQAKIRIDFMSFFRSTIPLDRGIFGVYCFTGKQGTGKTYGVTKYVKNFGDQSDKIYSNLTIKGTEYEKIRSIQHLLSLKDEENRLIIFDEIFTVLNDKTIPRDIRDDLMEFLSQQRKMKNILMTTAQEWLNIPIEFRRFVRIQVECRTIPLGRWGGVFIETYYDATQMEWSQFENEYVAPRISMKISKYQARFMNAYDTYERIRRLKRRED